MEVQPTVNIGLDGETVFGTKMNMPIDVMEKVSSKDISAPMYFMMGIKLINQSTGTVVTTAGVLQYLERTGNTRFHATVVIEGDDEIEAGVTSVFYCGQYWSFYED